MTTAKATTTTEGRHLIRAMQQKRKKLAVAKNTICLWYDKDAARGPGRDRPLLERDRRNGGQMSECGWCKDRWGLSWQITPRVLTEALAAGGDEARRAFGSMMGMKKIDVAAIRAARDADNEKIMNNPRAKTMGDKPSDRSRTAVGGSETLLDT